MTWLWPIFNILGTRGLFTLRVYVNKLYSLTMLSQSPGPQQKNRSDAAGPRSPPAPEPETPRERPDSRRRIRWH